MTNICPALVAQASTPIPARHAEIARRYAWDDRNRRGQRRPRLISVLRLRQLENFYAYTYGPTLPDDDAGRDELFVIAQHLAQGAALDRHLPAWARLWAPWLGEVECTDLIDRVTSKPLRWTADTLAWRIGLNDATRTLLKITTIGAIDLNKVQRAERRKQRDAAAHRARRAAVVSVSDYEEKPWEAQGISRATWYRRGKPTAPASLRQNASTADTTAYAVDRNRLTTGSAPQRSASNAAGAAKPGFNFHITGRLRLASLAVLLPAVNLKLLNRPATLGSAPMARLGAQSGAGSAP